MYNKILDNGKSWGLKVNSGLTSHPTLLHEPNGLQRCCVARIEDLYTVTLETFGNCINLSKLLGILHDRLPLNTNLRYLDL